MAAAQVQALLRFLTQDAKIPLTVALSKVPDLRKADLQSAETIASADIASLRSVFPDEKLAKQILSAAKRVTNPKKRASSAASPRPAKRARGVESDVSVRSLEDDLALPLTDVVERDLTKIVLQANRAPLVLAFAVALLKHSMPEQPLSSRLSLAQAVVSANSQSKAKSIGLTSEITAEEDGWAKGQPKLKVLGREIAVMRRAKQEVVGIGDSQATAPGDGAAHETYWGLDLEALRKSNGPLVGSSTGGGTGLPIYRPESARNYLLRSFSVVKDVPNGEDEVAKNAPMAKQKKPTGAELSKQKEDAAALLLKALDLLYESWASTLTSDELDKRAWGWYVRVRPDVAQGQAGWGQKGLVSLDDILKLRREQ